MCDVRPRPATYRLPPTPFRPLDYARDSNSGSKSSSSSTHRMARRLLSRQAATTAKQRKPRCSRSALCLSARPAGRAANSSNVTKSERRGGAHVRLRGRLAAPPPPSKYSDSTPGKDCTLRSPRSAKSKGNEGESEPTVSRFPAPGRYLLLPLRAPSLFSLLAATTAVAPPRTSPLPRPPPRPVAHPRAYPGQPVGEAPTNVGTRWVGMALPPKTRSWSDRLRRMVTDVDE